MCCTILKIFAFEKYVQQFFLISEMNKESPKNLADFGFTRDNSSVLHISSVSYDDAGFYQCIVNNGIPPNLKANFSITIRGKIKALSLMLSNYSVNR